MGRTRRPNLPGLPFHITARIQGKAPAFVGLESVVTRVLEEQAAAAGGELLAYAIMPNHLHVIYVQGDRPLAALMQPLLRRLALQVHRRARSEGHVFERRFRASACLDPDYLRNAIAYVHLNPVRARLCDHAEQYAWTSHHEYMRADPGDFGWSRRPVDGLRLFTPTPCCSAPQARDNYLAWVAWRIRADAALAAGRGETEPPPHCRPGDAYFTERFHASCARRPAGCEPRRPTLDLRDLARRCLEDTMPGMSLELLRSGGRGKQLVPVRRHFILRARGGGHRVRPIARFLNLSEGAVSRTR